MIKNKDFRRMITAAAVCTVAVSVCEALLAGPAAGVIALLFGCLLTGVFAGTTKKRYKDIDEMNTYLVKVLSGQKLPDIADQEEGELSLLRNNIYKTSTALIHQKELLSKDKTALADAIADISHQLKTPLTSMMVMNDLLRKEDDPEKRAEFLKTQSSQLDRMNWLIQTLLKLSKIDAGTITMKMEKVSCGELFTEALKPFAIQMELQDITCECVGGDLSLQCDRNWTLEALQNIIKNCIEHMDQGGSLSIRSSDTNTYREIIIKDTGCGIAEDDLPHIFERFYKGKNAGKDSVGIGLALAKSIMESQRGDILVESRQGEGTAFFLRLYKTII
ncbi:MAG: HAMP domain-containing histidine kinase [Lachnospiraceae bacterium]|nr:HAMP domain-containing histidine kinase [Lachnospiraceae bacterium]